MLSRLVMTPRVQMVRWAFNCTSWKPTEQDLQIMSCGINDEDRREVAKFVFLKDAKMAIIGRFLTKKFLTEATGLSWRNVKVLRDPVNNKPYSPLLVDNNKLQFNISHSGDLVILAGEVGNLELGVDLMKVEKQRATSVKEFFRLMNSQFAQEEWDVIKSRNTEHEQLSMFYRYWCLKESYTKATGTGIYVDLKKICFKLKTFELSQTVVINDTEVFVDGKKQDGWIFEESMVDQEHIASVARHFTNRESDLQVAVNPFEFVSLTDLISYCEQISELDIGYCKDFMAKKNP